MDNQQQTKANKISLIKQMESQELQSKEFGMYWQNIEQLFDQIKSECEEVKEASTKSDRNHFQEEIGDLIQASIGLAVFCEFDVEETMKKSVDKFQTRFDIVKRLAIADGYKTLRGESFDTLMHYWNLSKANSAINSDSKQLS